MSSSPSTSSIRSILALAERRDALLAEIARIDSDFSSILNGREPSNSGTRTLGHKTGNGRVRPPTLGKRGRVHDLILEGLTKAGSAGIAVKHLAANLGMKPQNVHAWFNNTGKKRGLVAAVGRGVYRLEEAIGVDTPQESLRAPKAVIRRKRAKRGSK